MANAFKIVLRYQIIVIFNSVIYTLAPCPIHCDTIHDCTDPDQGCPSCEPAYWGRHCEYRTECQIDRKTNYMGLRNTTIDGITCQDWSSQTPHAHNITDVSLTNNYCRNVDRQFPWCFTTDQTIEWRYCGVKLCDFQCPPPPLKSDENVTNPPSNGFEVGLQIHILSGSESRNHMCMPGLCWSDLTCPDSNRNDKAKTSSNCPPNCKSGKNCTDPDKGCPSCEPAYWGRQCQYRTECLLERNGILYRGLRNTTRLGMQCQDWSAQAPQQHPFSGPELTKNHCRNPSGYTFGKYYPWCYTTDAKKGWDYCGINYCYLQCSPPKLSYGMDVLNPPAHGFHIGYVISLYNGAKSTVTNHTCTPELCWSSLTCRSQCPPNCKRKKCKDPDGGCAKCSEPFWGRHCQYRMECRNDHLGITYRGLKNVTKTGFPCESWSSQNFSTYFMDGVDLTENYCRNPDNSDKPWCYIAASSGDMKKFCDVKSCRKHCPPPPLGPFADVLNPPAGGFHIGDEIEITDGNTTTNHTCKMNRCWSGLTCSSTATTASPAVTSTRNSTQPSTTPENLNAKAVTNCCMCKVSYLNSSWSGIKNDELFQINLAELKRELSVNKTTLSSYIRKKTSAGDDRQSAARIGYVGASAIVIVIISFVVCDLHSYMLCNDKYRKALNDSNLV